MSATWMSASRRFVEGDRVRLADGLTGTVVGRLDEWSLTRFRYVVKWDAPNGPWGRRTEHGDDKLEPIP